MAFFRQDDKNDELSLVVDIDFLINQAFFQQIVKRNVSQFRKFLLRWHKSAADQLFIKNSAISSVSITTSISFTASRPLCNVVCHGFLLYVKNDAVLSSFSSPYVCIDHTKTWRRNRWTSQQRRTK